MKTLPPSKAPGTHALILLCKKCGKKLDGDPVKVLSRLFKAQSKAKFGGKGVKVCTVSCMKLCPKKAVAVAIVPFKNVSAGAQFFCVLPEDSETFVQQTCATL